MIPGKVPLFAICPQQQQVLTRVFRWQGELVPCTSNKQKTKRVRNAQWLARKWDSKKIVLCSFTHSGEEKAIPDTAPAPGWINGNSATDSSPS
jgi:hypothetical protein